MTRKTRLLWLAAAALSLPAVAWASGASEMFTRHTLLLIVMITLADWCGWLFERLGMPELVGQIFAGIILGNLALAGVEVDVSEMLRSSHFMQYSAELAVVLLLFLVGLESNMRDLVRVGANSAKVAVVGVALPVFMGLMAVDIATVTSNILKAYGGMGIISASRRGVVWSSMVDRMRPSIDMGYGSAQPRSTGRWTRFLVCWMP